jgi:predicted dinucleotide-utilizing enzyme
MRTLEEAEDRIKRLEEYVEYLKERLEALVECASDEALRQAKENVGDI